VSGFIKPFHWGGKIKKIGLFSVKELKSGRFIYYGILFFNSRKAGLRLIKKLNGKRFKRMVIEVREFIIRSRKNDRRLAQKNLSPDILERRKGERRRDVWADVSDEKRMQTSSSIFDRENVYLPRRTRDN